MVTACLILVLSLLSMIEAIYLGPNQANYPASVSLFEMKSVLSSGLLLVCVLILHNWFKRIGIVCAIWMSSIYLQLLIQLANYKSDSNKTQAETVA